MANIARQAQIDPKSCERYFEILNDTLIGFYLPSTLRLAPTCSICSKASISTKSRSIFLNRQLPIAPVPPQQRLNANREREPPCSLQISLSADR